MTDHLDAKVVIEEVEPQTVEVVRKPAPQTRRTTLVVTIPAEDLTDLTPEMRRLYGLPLPVEEAPVDGLIEPAIVWPDGWRQWARGSDAQT